MYKNKINIINKNKNNRIKLFYHQFIQLRMNLLRELYKKNNNIEEQMKWFNHYKKQN